MGEDCEPIQVALLNDLTDREMKILDAYEDDEYSRTPVTIQTVYRREQCGNRSPLCGVDACDWALGRGEKIIVEWEGDGSTNHNGIVSAQVYLWSAPSPEVDLELKHLGFLHCTFFP